MLDGLPDIYARILPELRPAEHGREARATCASCAMWPDDDPAGRRTFVRPHRCCTYVPSLPNFLVGRALARGGPGADRLRARIRDMDGVTAIGILPTDAENERYGDGSAFGLDPEHRCPYFVGGELSCGIWADRNGVCRTWHCRWEHGRHGRHVGNAVRDLLDTVEVAVAALVGTGAPWPWAGEDAWVAYFRETTTRADALGPQDVAALRKRPKIAGGLVTLRTTLAYRDRPVPDVLTTAPHEVEVTPAGTWLIYGEERWDPVDAPPAVLGLLLRLKDGAPWRDAAEDLGIPAAIVERLWRVRAVT